MKFGPILIASFVKNQHVIRQVRFQNIVDTVPVIKEFVVGVDVKEKEWIEKYVGCGCTNQAERASLPSRCILHNDRWSIRYPITKEESNDSEGIDGGTENS